MSDRQTGPRPGLSGAMEIAVEPPAALSGVRARTAALTMPANSDGCRERAARDNTPAGGSFEIETCGYGQAKTAQLLAAGIAAV